MRAMKFKKSLKQTIAENNKGHALWGAMSGKPVPEDFQSKPEPAKPPRKPPTASDPHELEASVQREVFSVLAKHPSVLFAVRQNSGAAMSGNVPIWFYRWARRNGVEMTLTDFWGMLRDGRMFAMECKKRSWKKVTGTREMQQSNFIDVVRSAGGVGGFVTCAEDAMRVLNE